MKIRRVVTAKNEAGKSTVVSDGNSPREVQLEHTPGFVASPLWMTHGTPDLSAGTKDPMADKGSLLASSGGMTFIVVTFPPDAVMMSPNFNPAQAGPEHLVATPGIAETFEMDNPGMHTTPTVDCVTVIKGPVVLELDDGKTVTLNTGDTVVQHGVRHAWRNPFDEAATVSFVMLGAKGA